MSKINHVVLFSGGFDSTALLCHLVKGLRINANEIIALNIYYGQRNKPEIITANYITKLLNIKLDYIDISSITNKIFNSSALVNEKIEIDKNKSIKIDKQPNSYVPNRNMLFISIALSYAENIGAHKIYTAIQPHELYYYWDATKLFIDKLNSVVSLNPYDLEIIAPFSEMSKHEIYDYIKTINAVEILECSWSCYSPVKEENDEKIIYKPCGECGACLERNKVLPQKEIVIYKDKTTVNI